MDFTSKAEGVMVTPDLLIALAKAMQRLML
jgi:hypothetical protein